MADFSFSDLANQYATARLKPYTDLYNDPQAAITNRVYGDLGLNSPDQTGNIKPKSTTVAYNDDGTHSYTHKFDVAPTDYSLFSQPTQPAEQTRSFAPPVQQPVAQPPQPTGPQVQFVQQANPTPVQTPQPAMQQPAMQQPAPAPVTAPVAPTAVEQPAPAPAPAPVAPTAQLAPPAAGASSEGTAGEAEAQANMQQQQQQEQQPPKTQDEIHHDAVVAARNETNPSQRLSAYSNLLADKTVSPENKALAQRFIAEDYLKERDRAEAEKKIQEATPNDLARYMREKSGKEGSLVKAILYARLGLTDLAQKEQDLISPTVRTGAELLDGKRYTVERNRDGDIVKAFNAQGKSADQTELAQLSANSVGKIAAAKPGAEYKGPNGEIGRVVTVNKPNGMTETYIESNGTRISPEDAKSWKPTSLINANVKSEKTTEETIKRQANQTTELGNRKETSAQITQAHAGGTAFNRAAGSAAGRLGTELGTSVPFAQMGGGGGVRPAAGAATSGVNTGAPAGPVGAGPRVTEPANVARQTEENVPGKPPAYDSTLSPMQNKEIQKNWAAENKKILTDFAPSGGAGKQIVAITTATNHINDDLKPLVSALKLGDYKTANKIAQKFDIWSGGADVTNYNFVAHAVADEVSKTLTNGSAGALGDRQAMEAHFDSIASKQGLDGVIKEAERVMAGKTESLEAQYKRSGRRDFYTNVVSDPRVKEVVDRIRADRNVIGGQAPQGTVKSGARWKEVQ
jgi:hypothetical protein